MLGPHHSRFGVFERFMGAVFLVMPMALVFLLAYGVVEGLVVLRGLIPEGDGYIVTSGLFAVCWFVLAAASWVPGISLGMIRGDGLGAVAPFMIRFWMPTIVVGSGFIFGIFQNGGIDILTATPMLMIGLLIFGATALSALAPQLNLPRL